MPDGPRPTEQDAVDHFFASPAPAAEPATSRKTSRLAAVQLEPEPPQAFDAGSDEGIPPLSLLRSRSYGESRLRATHRSDE